MKTKLYSYRDNLVGFGPVMVENNEQTAIRGFSFAVNNASGMMGLLRRTTICTISASLILTPVLLLLLLCRLS